MCGVWLVGVLMTAAVDANRMLHPAEPARLIGADDDDVMVMLGQPQLVLVRRTYVTWLYERVDCFGGRHQRLIVFSVWWIVDDDCSRFVPFAETPPWLDALRDALRLRRWSPAGNS